MSVPPQIPLIPFPTLESLLGGVSAAPFAWPLTAFCTWALQKQELSEAPVRSVSCNRQGVHEFVLLSCDVNTASAVTTLWIRIERHPSSQGVGVLLNKSKPAVDTLKASTNLQALREPCESRDSFMYNPNDNPRQVLKFKHIAEMCQYFTGHSCEYSLLGANCRWICYALLESLRESQPCYGGTWFASRTERPTADVRAAQLAKSHYLKDKHPTCCGSQYLVYPSFGAHVARATAGLASIAVVGSSQNTRNRDSQYAADQEVIYRTSRSLPESAVPRHQPPISTTSAGLQPPSANGALTSNTSPSNVTELPPGHGATQPNRQQNGVSPIPVGANIAQHPQSPPISEDIPSSSQAQQHNTTPPVKHTVSQPTGGMSTSHCSGCQCTSHSNHENVSNDPQPALAPSQSPLPDSRGGDTSGLASRLSSMNIQSDASVVGTSHGQWVENITIPREPSSSEVPVARQCSCCGPQGDIPTQRPASTFVPVPAMSNATCNSLGTACTMHPGHIHPGVSQRSVTSAGAGPAQRNGTPSMVAHHPGHYGRHPSQVSSRTSLPPAHGSHTRRVSDGSNTGTFNVSHQCLSQISFPGPMPSMTGVAASCAVHHNRTSSLGCGCTDCDPRASMHTQGYHHTHNHPPPEQPIDSLSPVSHGYSFSHVNDVPRARHTHEMPPIPTHQGTRGNSHTCSNQSRNSTRDSYLAPENYTHGPSSPLPRHSVNRNGSNQFQAFYDHTYVPPSPGYNGNLNMPEGHYHSTHNLYRIPEDAPQPELETQWNLASGPMGVQPMLPNHAQPSSNPLAQLTSNYPPSQHSETVFQQSYMPSGLPADPYSPLEPPNRQWTREVWGNQEIAPPIRTDSPTQLEYPSSYGVEWR
ncbi:hypothetical protein RSAG8_00491, partial [Rhizoctonia solani AG-8 WAC10335]